MKEIKFRAWDNEAEEFIYSDQQYDDAFFEFAEGTLKAYRIVLQAADDVYPFRDWLERNDIKSQYDDNLPGLEEFTQRVEQAIQNMKEGKKRIAEEKENV